MSALRRRLLKRFRDPDYRHSYMESFLDSLIATQIRTLREREKWSQKELADKVETTQPAISRLERPDHSAWSLKTLRSLARAFDMALSVKFVSFGDAVQDIEGFRADRLIRPSFGEDPVFLSNEEVETGGEGSNLVEGVVFGKPKRGPEALVVSELRSGAA